MLSVWKVTYADGKTEHVWAMSKWQVLHEMHKTSQVLSVVSVVRNACEDRTNPFEKSGLPGHRLSRPNQRLIPIVK